MPNISPIGDAIHGDFYSITGSNFPPTSRIVFTTSAGVVTVAPDLVRPHLLFVERLPNAIQEGRGAVHVEAGTWTSDTVSVRVSAGQPQFKRVIYPGRPVTRAYTIVFIANPAIEAAAGGTYSRDPVLTNVADYHSAVTYCLRNLFMVSEDFLTKDNLDAHIRIVSLFLPHLPANAANALTKEDSVPGSTIMEPRRNEVVPFLERYFETADVAFLVHDSASYSRASANLTDDDDTRDTTAFTYDGKNYGHGHFPSIPGTIAFYVRPINTMTAIHEFAHAASSYSNGGVSDLYVDGSPGTFSINKKWRASANAAIPAHFANYNGTDYKSDPSRDGLGYLPLWTSYHSELTNPAEPNVMDLYPFATDPKACRLDHLTRDWFQDRLRAKVFR